MSHLPLALKYLVCSLSPVPQLGGYIHGSSPSFYPLNVITGSRPFITSGFFKNLGYLS